MATATYFKNTPNSSAATSFTWALSVPVGSTVYVSTQHQAGGAVAFTDNSSADATPANRNAWLKEKATLDYTAAVPTSQRIGDVYSCQPVTAITSVTVTGTASFWVMSAAVVNALVSTLSSALYAGTQPTTGSLQVTTNSIALAFIFYNATTAGTEGAAMASPWTNAGINNFGTTQSDIWKIAAPAANGTQSAVVSTAAGVSNYGVIALAVSAASANVAPTVTAGGTQTVVAGSSVTFSFSASDDVAVSSLTGAVTGPAAVTLSGSASGTSASASRTYAPTATFPTPGVYTVTATATDANALTGTASTTVYVYPASGNYAFPVAVTGSWTNVGGAADLLTAITDSSASTYGEAAPGVPLFVYLAPQGPGAITIGVEGYWNTGTVSRTLTLYKADGVTQIDTVTYDPTSSDNEKLWAVSVTQTNSLVPAATDRQALVLKIQDA